MKIEIYYVNSNSICYIEDVNISTEFAMNLIRSMLVIITIEGAFIQVEIYEFSQLIVSELNLEDNKFRLSASLVCCYVH